jgi:16S rRNA (adenine1518-N6/adenine1519-N6)-dimethyltransferase
MVKPKKHLGQHFLEDEQIAQRIVEALQVPANCKIVVEIGAGTGVLTQYLVQKPEFQLYVAEIDTESVAYLHKKYADLKPYIQEVDFLTLDLNTWILPETSPEIAIISNFPYNISSQIFFKILDHKDRVTEVVGMLQKEVAERLASPAGTKDYGILSVFLQAYYEVEYLFTVEPEVFNPPPKVRSGVIRLKRNQVSELPCSDSQFRNVVKTASFLDLRAEQLSVADFIKLTLEIYPTQSAKTQ